MQDNSIICPQKIGLECKNEDIASICQFVVGSSLFLRGLFTKVVRASPIDTLRVVPEFTAKPPASSSPPQSLTARQFDSVRLHPSSSTWVSIFQHAILRHYPPGYRAGLGFRRDRTHHSTEGSLARVLPRDSAPR